MTINNRITFSIAFFIFLFSGLIFLIFFPYIFFSSSNFLKIEPDSFFLFLPITIGSIFIGASLIFLFKVFSKEEKR